MTEAESYGKLGTFEGQTSLVSMDLKALEPGADGHRDPQGTLRKLVSPNERART